tara:strand:+ start:150 stop:419 length:270 start_codon:yes stop_codon:yes gene_type:complete
MAITKSTTLKRIEVKPAKNSGAGSDQNDKYPTLLIIYNDSMYDDENKITTDVQRIVNYSKYITDGGAVTNYSTSADDVLVKQIGDTIWS